MEYKVCILAAGTGSRMMPLTKSINKSLLPVGGQAVLSRIIGKFDPKIEIVIAVGYLMNSIKDYLACTHSNRKIVLVEVDKFVGNGSGPGYSLTKCMPYLQCPFIFFASDTLVLEAIPEPSFNWMGIAPVLSTNEYCCVEIVGDSIVKLDDKVESNNKNAFIGVAGIKDFSTFFNSLGSNVKTIKGEHQVSNGFEALTLHRLKPIMFTWHDAGNLQGYVNVNKSFSDPNAAFDFSKTDEYIYFVENKVIKYFRDPSVTQNRYLRSLKLAGLCPVIEKIYGSFYSYKKIDGKVLYDVVNRQLARDLLVWLSEKLWVRKHLSFEKMTNFQNLCHDFYYKKTMLRLNNYHNKYGIPEEKEKITINGIKVNSLQNLLKKIDWQNICNGIPVGFHGDLQFDNIIKADAGSFILLDWRQDFAGLIEYGDLYYDLAKIYGGLLTSYKLIKSGHFSYLKLPDGSHLVDIGIPPELNDAKEEFERFVLEHNLDLIRIKTITGLIYLNMSPMHHEPFDHFIYFYGHLVLESVLFGTDCMVSNKYFS
jgi:choline kinase